MTLVTNLKIQFLKELKIPKSIVVCTISLVFILMYNFGQLFSCMVQHEIYFTSDTCNKFKNTIH